MGSSLVLYMFHDLVLVPFKVELKFQQRCWKSISHFIHVQNVKPPISIEFPAV